MYWRRFSVSSIPIDDPSAFELWLSRVWQEKDDILEYYAQHGRFPADESAIVGQESANGTVEKSKDQEKFLETEVKLDHWIEIGQMFVVPATLLLIANLFCKAWNFVVR